MKSHVAFVLAFSVAMLIGQGTSSAAPPVAPTATPDQQPVPPAAPPTIATEPEAEAPATVTSIFRDRALKRMVREKVLREGDLDKYGLWLDNDWREKDAALDVVILIHGLDSSPDSTSALLEPARAAKLPCGKFSYPNDEPIDESAELLAKHLRNFAEKHPGRRISLVTHSMGGLVARAVIENPELDPGIVRRLIMVAPPTHGSRLARLGVGLDLLEHTRSSENISKLARFRAAVVDGLDEAVEDMEPDSAFLKKLNARKRNPNVRYSIILGSQGVMKETDLGHVKSAVQLYLSSTSFLKRPVESLAAGLNDLDEVLIGKGDGAVSITRGKLEGVDDTLILEFDHLAVAEAPGDSKSVAQVHEAIKERLVKSK